MKPGTHPLYTRIPPAVLDQVCALVSSGMATLIPAFDMYFPTSERAVYRSLEASIEALDKEEAGESLDAREQLAYHFGAKVRRAMAHRHVMLTARALGQRKQPDGSYKHDARTESSNALVLLRLTTREFRNPYISKEERELQNPIVPPVEPVDAPTLPTEDELRPLAAARGFVLVQAPPSAYDPATAAPANPEP